MKNKLLTVTILFLAVLVIASPFVYRYFNNNHTTYTINELTHYYTIDSMYAEIFIEKDYLTEKEMLEIARMINKGIEDVKQYLGADYNKIDFNATKITYIIKSGEFISSAASTSVNLSYVKENRSPYIHETVHVMAGIKSTKWLQEGLAVYVEQLFTENREDNLFSRDIHLTARDIMLHDSFNEVLSFDDKYAMYHLQGGQDLRVAFYYVSSSLVKYIDEVYGKEVLLNIYNSQDIREATGCSFEDIKQDWMKYLGDLED